MTWPCVRTRDPASAAATARAAASVVVVKWSRRTSPEGYADAQASIVPNLFHNAEPNPMLQAMAREGETGLDAGKGFYDWTGCDVEAVRRQYRVFKQAADRQDKERVRAGQRPPHP